MDLSLLEIFFWLNFLIVIYAYTGFPLVLIIRGFLFSKPYKKNLNFYPKISICMAAYNEEMVIEQKIKNVIDLNYPSDKWEFIIASDGSSDKTVEIIKNNPHPQIHFLDLPRVGKNYALNATVEKAKYDIIVFTDADTIFKDGSINHLLAPFVDQSIGCVVGNFMYEDKIKKNEGELTYWNFDRFVKRCQSKSGNVTSATGQIYAIRRNLFKPIPPSVIDDACISMQIISAGYRMVFAPDAIGTSPTVDSSNKEFKRKIRIMAGSFRGLWYLKHLFNPFKYGFFSFQLFSHKVLRRLVAFPLIAILVLTPFLWNKGFIYQYLLVAEVTFHLLAIIGFLFSKYQKKDLKIVTLPFFLYLVAYATIRAVILFIGSRQHDVWVPLRTEEFISPNKTI